MANNTLSGAGIVTGQIVQAAEITQFVNAFTGVPVNSKGYDITISGSLNLTGSLLMTGSFINEFSGQFTSLGLGVVAPTAPTMLHIKDTAAGGDPIVLLEGNAGTDNARIRFSNSDVSYDLGAYGSSDDDFQIVQDAGGTVLTPFIVGKNTPTETFQIYNGILGIGMGNNFNSNPSNLPVKSIQAFETVSGSLLQGLIISASGVGVGTNANIYGTASQALYAGSAGTIAGGVNLGSVVMTGTNTSAFSASGNFNTAFNISSAGSGTILSKKFKLASATSEIMDYVGATIISGSDTGLHIGYPTDNGTEIVINDDLEKILIKAPNYLYVVQDGTNSRTVFSNEVRISGSATPELLVGPIGANGANFPSSSLNQQNLSFDYGGVNYIRNSKPDNLSRLALSVGSNAANGVGLVISGSTGNFSDTVTNKSIQILNRGAGIADSSRLSLRAGANTGATLVHARSIYEINPLVGNGVTSFPLITFDCSSFGIDQIFSANVKVLGGEGSSDVNACLAEVIEVLMFYNNSSSTVTLLNTTVVSSQRGSSVSAATVVASVNSSNFVVTCTGVGGKNIQFSAFMTLDNNSQNSF